MQIVRSITAYFLSLLLFLPVAGSELSLHYCCGELYSIEWRGPGSPADACGMEDETALSGGGVACCTFATVALQQAGTSSENRQVNVVSEKFLPSPVLTQSFLPRLSWPRPAPQFPSFPASLLSPALPIWLAVRVLRL